MSGGPTRCRYCGAPILWARTAKGRRIPLAAVPVAGGNLDLDPAAGQVAYVAGPVSTEVRYVSHFATCPSAGKARKGGSRG